MDDAIPPRARTPPAPKPARRAPPAKLGIKKRKPRPSSVISAANQRARQAAAAKPFPPVHPPQLPPLPDPPVASSVSAARAPARRGGAAEGEGKRKGLRHFAVRVSRKVEEKGVTTYNEVADELVLEEKDMKHEELAAGGKAAVVLQKKLAKRGTLVDEKNIRRRVYDSLNVLMAMGIIKKEKKLISWQGLAMARSAGGSGEVATVTAAMEERRRSLEGKKAMYAELQEQFTRTKALMERNSEIAVGNLGSVEELLQSSEQGEQVHYLYPDRLGIPFIIVSAPKDTSIELEMDQGREDICFTFNAAFAIYDDREILRRMNLSPITRSASGNDMLEADRLGHHLMRTTTPPSSP